VIVISVIRSHAYATYRCLIMHNVVGLPWYRPVPFLHTNDQSPVALSVRTARLHFSNSPQCNVRPILNSTAFMFCRYLIRRRICSERCRLITVIVGRNTVNGIYTCRKLFTYQRLTVRRPFKLLHFSEHERRLKRVLCPLTKDRMHIVGGMRPQQCGGGYSLIV